MDIFNTHNRYYDHNVAFLQRGSQQTYDENKENGNANTHFERKGIWGATRGGTGARATVCATGSVTGETLEAQLIICVHVEGRGAPLDA